MTDSTPDPPASIGIIIPTLQEASTITDCLLHLNHQDPPFEVVVVDGGSKDQTIHLATLCRSQLAYPLQVESSPSAGRAMQMNWGAARTDARILLFLHADTRLPPQALNTIRWAMQDPDTVGGRFEVKLDSAQWPYPLISWGINTRSRLTGYFTGDMGIFVRTSIFQRLEGFPPYPLMEDLEMSGRLKAIGRTAFLRGPILTSSRRFQTYGPWRTIGMMQVLRASYRLGVKPEQLVKWYRSAR